MIQAILKNENYVGNLVYNRTSRRLGQKLIRNPHHLWIRNTAGVERIIDQDLFARAQKLMAERYTVIPEDEMLRRLRLTLARKGKLSDSIIRNADGLPSTQCYVKHFGSIRKAYALIGYKASRDCAWYDARQHWSDVLSNLVARVAEALRTELGIQVNMPDDGPSLTLNGRRKIRFQVVRQLAKRGANQRAQWRAHRPKPDADLLVILRLNAPNKEIQDYVLVPASGCPRYLTLSDASLARHRAVRVATVDELIAEVKVRIILSTHAAPAKLTQQNKRRKLSRPKTKNGLAQH
ncbi:recombinase family protein [Bradyrhizobium retamae]|uniref:Recombinase domain-containing protein n=1 Tax=Bradyrhizobium retamae TaxID=1300035 RepID=A0A0R3N122_9BRAD|nr:recombinase family protein [Bradyrhizobium retamae]KRR23270.1 hypothetical protein CQ13_27675 [Bradyrhizobium retamae]